MGASLIAANISAEQIVGMSGSGYAIGLAISSYEWMAALTLLIVGKFFLPIFLKNQIYTMPQFLEQRYGTRIRTLMAVFWLGLYVFVNLTSILWLGSIAVEHVTSIPQDTALMLLAAFALLYQFKGGLKAVALTDIVQVDVPGRRRHRHFHVDARQDQRRPGSGARICELGTTGTRAFPDDTAARQRVLQGSAWHLGADRRAMGDEPELLGL